MKKFVFLFATVAILAASSTDNAEMRAPQERIDNIDNRQHLKALMDSFSIRESEVLLTKTETVY